MLKNPFLLTANNGVKQVVLTFASPPTGVVIAPSKLRFNKPYAITFDQDDNLSGIFKTMLPLFTGGVPEFEPAYTSPGRFINDGFGGQVTFKASTHAWYNPYIDSSWASYWDWATDGSTGGNTWADDRMSFPRLDALRAKGFGFNSHGYYSNLTGYTPAELATFPALFCAWLEGLYGNGARPFNQGAGGGQTFDELAWSRAWLAQGALMGSIKSEYIPTGYVDQDFVDLNLDTSNMPEQIFVDRWGMDGATISEITTRIDLLMGYPSGYLLRLFNHNITDAGGFTPYLTLKAVADYIQATYADTVWVPSANELVRYLHVRDKVIINQVVEGNTLTLSFDQSAIPNYVTERYLTFTVEANENIQDINITAYTNKKKGIGTTTGTIDLKL